MSRLMGLELVEMVVSLWVCRLKSELSYLLLVTRTPVLSLALVAAAILDVSCVDG